MVGMPVDITEHSSLLVESSAVALLKVLLRQCPFQSTAGRSPPMIVRRLSHGSADTPIAHGTTVAVGQLCDEIPIESPKSRKANQMSLLEANIDHCTAERLAFCVDRLLQDGASDAWVTPIVMKKGRAAHTLHCLCQTQLMDTLLEVMFRNSTTLGIRVKRIDRVALQRTLVTVQTKWANIASSEGFIDVKVGYLDGEVVSMKKNECEHCKKIALATGEPVQVVVELAVQLAREQLSPDR